VKQLTL